MPEKNSFPFVSAPKSATVIPVDMVARGGFPNWLKQQNQAHQKWANAQHYAGAAEHYLRLPTSDGQLAKIVGGYNPESPFTFGALLHQGLSGNGTFELTSSFGAEADFYICLGWAAAAYRFTRYKQEASPKNLKLVIPKTVNVKHLKAHVGALYLIRDLINTPANDMNPADLALAAKKLAEEVGAEYHDIVGEDLLTQDFPAIHAVGRAAEEEPRLVEIKWGNPKHPRLALIGKGVTFDTGGLNIKPAEGMFLMKKDMGGAAHALALLKLIAAYELPIYVHLLIPAVENSIAGNAYRPSDVLQTRSGYTIEIGNTDAEGRVIMSDCMTYASEFKPDFVIDFATLTGHARSVIGYETGIFFSNDKKLLPVVMDAVEATYDDIWPLPMKRSHMMHLGSHVADIRNQPTYAYGNAIHAALFLEKFLGDKPAPWIHVDCSGWTLSPSPGHPPGGDACGLRAIFKFLLDRYAG